MTKQSVYQPFVWLQVVQLDFVPYADLLGWRQFLARLRFVRVLLVLIVETCGWIRSASLGRLDALGHDPSLRWRLRFRESGLEGCRWLASMKPIQNLEPKHLAQVGEHVL